MRIHLPPPAALQPDALPPLPFAAWQIVGHSVRQVLMRRLDAAGAWVSRLVCTGLSEGAAFGFTARTRAAQPGDLFSSETEARAECDLRRLRTHCPRDRRRLRVDSPTVAPRMPLPLVVGD